jgi:hypothetical protein
VEAVSKYDATYPEVGIRDVWIPGAGLDILTFDIYGLPYWQQKSVRDQSRLVTRRKQRSRR